MSCHHNESVELFTGFGEYGIVVTLFLTGLFGSFSHCMFMCGPLALGISNMRLMGCASPSISEFERFKIVLCLPYYFGKATTYVLLALLLAYISDALADYQVIRYVGAILLALVALSFVYMAFSGGVDLGVKLPQKFLNFISSVTKGSSYGVRGLFQGMVLGFIPCALVLSSIATAIAYSDNLLIMALSVFAFGIATVPALLMVSYFGNLLQSRFKGRVFKIAFGMVMLFNAFLLLRYALKLI